MVSPFRASDAYIRVASACPPVRVADVVVDFAVAFFVVNIVGVLAVASFVDLELVVRSAVDAVQYTADTSVPLTRPHIPLQAHPVEPCPYQARLSLASPSKSAS